MLRAKQSRDSATAFVDNV